MMDEGKTTLAGMVTSVENTGQLKMDIPRSAERSEGEFPHRSAERSEGEFPRTQNEKEQEAVTEAVLFTMGRSVELRQLAAAIGQDKETARKAVERLKARYDKNKNCGMQIIVLEASYQMCTKSKYYENLIRVAATPKKQVLTEVVLETLSIIAYKQPVTKLEIEKIRGVKSDHAVNRLVEYNLVYEVGRLDAPGRPALFATTEEFLRRFGVGSTDDLPSMNPEQAEEIKAEVEEELQLKLEDLSVQAESGAEAEVRLEEAGDSAGEPKAEAARADVQELEFEDVEDSAEELELGAAGELESSDPEDGGQELGAAGALEFNDSENGGQELGAASDEMEIIDPEDGAMEPELEPELELAAGEREFSRPEVSAAEHEQPIKAPDHEFLELEFDDDDEEEDDDSTGLAAQEAAATASREP